MSWVPSDSGVRIHGAPLDVSKSPRTQSVGWLHCTSCSTGVPRLDAGSEMNKTYLRYELSETFGVVASPQSNVVYDSTGNLAISAALHEVAVWNLRQCSLVR